MGQIIELAIIRDNNGVETSWPLDDAIQSKNEGRIRYIGSRHYDDYVEYIFK